MIKKPPKTHYGNYDPQSEQWADKVKHESAFVGQGVDYAKKMLGGRLVFERTARGAVRMLLDGRDSPIQRIMMEAKKVEKGTA